MTSIVSLPGIAELHRAPERADLAILEVASLLVERALLIEHPEVATPARHVPAPPSAAAHAARALLRSLESVHQAIADYHAALRHDERELQEELLF